MPDQSPRNDKRRQNDNRSGQRGDSPPQAKTESNRDSKQSTRETQLLDREKNLTQRESALIERERAVLEKENAAVAGFAEKNLQSLKPLEQCAQALRDEINSLEAARVDASLRSTKEISKWKHSLMQEFEKQLANERQKFETDLSLRKTSLENEYAALIKSAQEKAATADQQNAEFQRKKLELDKQAEIVFKQKQQEVADQLADAEQNQTYYKQECDRLGKRVKQIEAEKISLRGMTQADSAKLLQEQEDEITKLQKDLATRPTSADVKRVKELEAGLQAERETRYDLQGKLNKLHVELNSKNYFETKQEEQRDLIDAYKAEIKVLKCVTEKKHKEYDALLTEIKGTTTSTMITENDEEYKRRMGDIGMSRFAARNSENRMPGEKEWLAQIESKMRSIGLVYPRRILYAFHTCLKISDWAPLTVLAGVSGTGKSELPSKYALFGGLHFEMVSVQPNWDSPQDIFGFFNYLDGRFNAKPLLRSMAQSQRSINDDGCSNQLLLVLLDEMNLSRVELYLSDLLSKWEARRGKPSVSVEFDLGSNCEKFNLILGRNVLFAGTINEDETTQSLSDKVLDRGNLLYFPRPEELHSRLTLNEGEAPKALPVDRWNSWIKEPSFLKDEGEQLNIYKTSLQKINEQMSKVERGLGHRVWQAMEVYLANHPEVIEAVQSKKDDQIQLSLTRAFEDQLVQRVIPKLRGIELSRAGVSRTALDQIRNEIFMHAPGLTKDFDRAMTSSRNTFVWREADYLKEAQEATK